MKISRRCWGNISAAMTKGMGASPTEKNITNKSSATTEGQGVTNQRSYRRAIVAIVSSTHLILILIEDIVAMSTVVVVVVMRRRHISSKYFFSCTVSEYSIVLSCCSCMV